MTGRKHAELVGIKKFYKLEDIRQRTNVKKKDLIEVALLSDALYKIGSIVLINKEKMDAFCEKMNLYNLDARAVYMSPKEAAEHLGMSLDFMYQISSRAKALYRINGKFFVNVELLNKYFAGYKVNYGYDFKEIYEALGFKEDEDDV